MLGRVSCLLKDIFIRNAYYKRNNRAVPVAADLWIVLLKEESVIATQAFFA